ncbi:MAG TPA: SDR family oxidoreductase [Gemmatimonadales bacterium]|nr:SDR family oxidoreductase [Gemmatimonadales bacterium]
MTTLAGTLSFVTGASRGIGGAVAQALVGQGATVVRVARSLSPGAHGRFRDFACDLTDTDAVAQLAGQIIDTLGVPDLVVNAAGSFTLVPFDAATTDQLRRELELNLVAPFAVARGFLPSMKARGSGMLVNIGSIADHSAFPDNTIYSAAKYGLRGLHETLRAEYRGSGVRCTLVSPGATDTSIWDPIDPDSRAGFTPRNAMLRPEDVADAVIFAATRPAHVELDWIRLGPAR